MTVGQLIAELMRHNADLPVLIADGERVRPITHAHVAFKEAGNVLYLVSGGTIVSLGKGYTS